MKPNKIKKADTKGQSLNSSSPAAKKPAPYSLIEPKEISVGLPFGRGALDQKRPFFATFFCRKRK
jgi:hypothetical protein